MTTAIRWIGAAGLGVCTLGAPADAGAQVVRGEVRDRESRVPVAGAAVVVRDSTREVIGFTRTDEKGAFVLRVPVSGYSVHVVRVGFAPESVSTAGLSAPDTTNVLVEMAQLFVALTPVVIEAEKKQIRESRVLGLNLKTMSTDLMTPSQLAVTSRGAHTYLDAIAALLPAGVMVSNRSQCVVMTRATRLGGQQACAMVVVDGVRVDDPATVLDMVQPQWLDHAIFVRAADAGVRFGTGAAGGVLVLFTKYGGYALPEG